MIGKRDICIECVYQLDNVSCFTHAINITEQHPFPTSRSSQITNF